MPCQDVKLDRASFYLISSSPQMIISSSKPAEVREQTSEEARPTRARYSIRSSNC